MRIIIETDSPQNGVSVTNPGAAVSASAPAALNGGNALESSNGNPAAAPSITDGILTINAGPPSADLVSAIAAMSALSGAANPIDAGPAPTS